MKKCIICGEPVHRYNARYCLKCAKFGQRMRTKRFPPKTQKVIWDYIKKNDFVCCYTGVELDLDNRKSPWYLVFDPLFAGPD